MINPADLYVDERETRRLTSKQLWEAHLQRMKQEGYEILSIGEKDKFCPGCHSCKEPCGREE